MAKVRAVVEGVLLTVVLGGCQADLGGAGQGDSPGNPRDLPGSGADEPVSIDDIETTDPDLLPDGVPLQSRVPRLSYDEFDRSVSDLLGMEVTPSVLFPDEQPNNGPYEDGGQRKVNERLLQEIVLTAEQLSLEAVENSSSYSEIVGCDPASESCRDEFIQQIVLRAYRRPASAEETQRFTELFDSGADLIQSGDAFRDGVQIVLETLLQSAKFLYRPEQGDGSSDEKGPLLDDYEIATRLAFLFWGRGPDQSLLDAASRGELSVDSTLEQQARRLADDARATDRVLDFHDRWLQMDGLAAAEKDPTVFPSFGPELAESMRAETRAFVADTVLTNDGAIIELLTSRRGAVDASLASLYGLSGQFGDTPSLVDFPPESGRKGLLTQAAFLSGHSSASTRTSPILRGVFILDRLLCQHIPPPPPGAEMQEPDTPPAGELVTTRQYFEWKTSMTSCAKCHNQINPAGFAFEHFDGIGAYRATEKEAPIQADGVITVGQSTIAFEDASQFIDELANLPRTRSCYAINWLSYAYGRDETAGDSRTLAIITQALSEGTFGVKDLLVAIAKGTAFSHLPPID